MTSPFPVLFACLVPFLACASASAQTCDDVDTDLDGLPDAAERVFGTDVDGADTDGDGLTDFEELTADVPTSPRDVDTNGDGFCDGPIAVDERCVAPAPGEEANACDAPGAGPPRPRGPYGVSGTHIFGCAAGPAPVSTSALLLILIAVRRRRRSRLRAMSS